MQAIAKFWGTLSNETKSGGRECCVWRPSHPNVRRCLSRNSEGKRLDSVWDEAEPVHALPVGWKQTHPQEHVYHRHQGARRHSFSKPAVWTVNLTLGGAGTNQDKETDTAPYGGGGAIPLSQNLTPGFSGDRDLVMGNVSTTLRMLHWRLSWAWIESNSNLRLDSRCKGGGVCGGDPHADNTGLLKWKERLTSASFSFERCVSSEGLLAANILPRKGCHHLSSYHRGKKRPAHRSVDQFDAQVRLPEKADPPGWALLGHLPAPQKPAGA